MDIPQNEGTGDRVDPALDIRRTMSNESKVKKSRRKHRNSKLGCTNCKRKQIKCDETLPICQNCQKKHDACSYLFMPIHEFQKLMRLQNANPPPTNLGDDDHNLRLLPDDSLTANIEKRLENTNRDRTTTAQDLYFENNGENSHMDSSNQTEAIGPSVNIDYHYNNGYHLLRKFDDSPAESNCSIEPITSLESRNPINSDYNKSVPDATKFDTVFGDFLNQVESHQLIPDLYQSLMKNSLCDTSSSSLADSVSDEPFFRWGLNKDNIVIPPNLSKAYFESYICGEDNSTGHNDNPTTLPSVSFFDFHNYKNHLSNTDDYSIKAPVFFSTNVAARKSLHNDDYYEDSSDDNDSYSESDINSNSTYENESDRETDSDMHIHTDSGNAHIYEYANNDHNDGYCKVGNNINDCPSITKHSENCEYLSNAKIVNRKFVLNRKSEIIYCFDPMCEQLKSSFKELNRKSNTKPIIDLNYSDINPLFVKLYGFEMNFSLLFSQLIQKSLLLFVSDVVKNILYKQKSILPGLDELTRVTIGGVCEASSKDELSNLTTLIHNRYICHYNNFSKSQREMLLSGFNILIACTPYHYSLRYKQSIKQCFKYIGTFTAGMFSITIGENDKPISDRVGILSSYTKQVLLNSKFLTVQNYNPQILTEILINLQHLKLQEAKNFNHRRWTVCFINLKVFLEKHSQFFKVFQDPKSLLGYHKGYIMRMLNEWYQISPHNLINLTLYGKINYDTEIMVLIHLTFLALGYYLDAITPGIRGFTRNSLLGSNNIDYNSIDDILKIYKLIRNKKFKLYGIYIVRLITFLHIRFNMIMVLLRNIYIPEFSGFPDMNSEERCKRLLNDWKFGHLVREMQKSSLDLKFGSYIEKYNYPTINLGAIDIKCDNKIKFKSKYEVISDFEQTNSGLLSKDYDPRINGFAASDISNALKVWNQKNPQRESVRLAKDDEEINSRTMRNCWKVENFIKLG